MKQSKEIEIVEQYWRKGSHYKKLKNGVCFKKLPSWDSYYQIKNEDFEQFKPKTK